MDKIGRVLAMYSRLSEGQRIYKSSFCLEMEISSRTFERDIEDIRLFLNELYLGNDLVYDRKEESYHLEHYYSQKPLSAMEITFLLEVLDSCCVLREDEHKGLVRGLIGTSEAGRRKYLEKVAAHYMKRYGKASIDAPILKMQWDLQQCIVERDRIRIILQNRKEMLFSPVDLRIYEDELYLFGYNDRDELGVVKITDIRYFKLKNEKFEKQLLEKYALVGKREKKERLEKKQDEEN